MSTSNLGTLTSTPKSISDATVTTGDSKDTYKFQITGTSNINLSLNEISSGDDADLRLYRDSNRNGRLDNRDRLVEDSTESSNHDDAINVQANAGTYFAQVQRYAGSSGDVTYDLDLSATLPAPTSFSSNLLPREVMAGDPNPFGYLTEDKTFSGFVGDSNTADVNYFGLVHGASIGESVDITLSGLSSDADIRLIRDSDANRTIGEDEQIRISNLGSTANESILDIDQAGSYYLQVSQYSGSTAYTLNFDYTSVPPV